MNFTRTAEWLRPVRRLGQALGTIVLPIVAAAFCFWNAVPTAAPERVVAPGDVAPQASAAPSSAGAPDLAVMIEARNALATDRSRPASETRAPGRRAGSPRPVRGPAAAAGT